MTGSRRHLNDRLTDNDPELIRLDITASALVDFSRWEKDDFIASIQTNKTVKHVHLSGDGLENCLSSQQIELLLDAIGYMENLEELFIFKGNNREVSGDRISALLKLAHKLKVFMLWGFAEMETEAALAGAIRHHPSLERVTITLPTRMKYACLDVFAMGFAGMRNLKCLCIRCKYSQADAILSPEAITLLLASTSLESLYLENCGLVDDHSDAIAEELKVNKKLTLVDLKHNLFTDDALYAFAMALKFNRTLLSLDLSGAYISEGGVNALAEAMQQNRVLTHLELEGEASRFVDEFDIPEGHKNTEYMQELNYRLRLNRAGKTDNRENFAEALNLVSDHLGCIYTLVRGHPKYCERPAASA